jgi:hypothetical protein
MQRKTLVSVAASILAAFAASVALASVTFTPPPASEKKMNMAMIKLVPQEAAPKASGMAGLVANKDKSKCKLIIDIKGLDPKKVYTAWLVKPSKSMGKMKMEMEMQGVGITPYKLKVDSKGSAKVVSQEMDVKAMMTWQSIEIVEHKDGNPKSMSMKSMVPVLVGDATKLR